MRELNLRDESDPNYRTEMMEVNDDIEALVYQIKMTLGTNRGEVLGEAGFGTDLDGMLFMSEFNANGFNMVVSNQIETYSELAQVYPVGVEMVQMPISQYRSAVMLDIKINGKSMFGVLLGKD